MSDSDSNYSSGEDIRSEEMPAQPMQPVDMNPHEDGPPPAPASAIPDFSFLDDSSPQSPDSLEENSEEMVESISVGPAGIPILAVFQSGSRDTLESDPEGIVPPPVGADFEQPQVNTFRMGVVVRDGSAANMQALLDCIQGLSQAGQTQHKVSMTDESQTGIMLHKSLKIAGVRYRAGHEYHVIENVGHGTFGEVNVCQDSATSMIFACKQVSLAKFERREVEVLLQLQNTSSQENYTPTIYGIVLQADVVYIFMQNIEKTWETLAKQMHEGRVSLETAEMIITHLTKQLLEALKELHMLGIRHCDIKPANLGCSHDHTRGYLIDFGTARVQMDPFTTKGMTPNYMSPEACRRIDDPKIDIWAAAASVLYMYTRQHPWSLERIEQPLRLLDYISKNGIVMITRYLNGISNLMSDRLYTLLMNMLNPDVHERWGAEECLQYLDDSGSRLSSTSGPASYPAQVPTTVCGAVLASSAPSSHVSTSALADTLPVDSYHQPRVAYQAPWPLKPLESSVSQTEHVANQRRGGVRHQHSAPSYNTQMQGCTIMDQSNAQEQSHMFMSTRAQVVDCRAQQNAHNPHLYVDRGQHNAPNPHLYGDRGQHNAPNPHLYGDIKREHHFSCMQTQEAVNLQQQRQDHMRVIQGQLQHGQQRTVLPSCSAQTFIDKCPKTRGHKHLPYERPKPRSARSSTSTENMDADSGSNPYNAVSQNCAPLPMHSQNNIQFNQYSQPHTSQHGHNVIRTQPQQIHPRAGHFESDSGGALDLSTRDGATNIPASVTERRQSSESNMSSKSRSNSVSKSSSGKSPENTNLLSTFVENGASINSSRSAGVGEVGPPSSSGYVSGISHATIMLMYSKEGFTQPSTSAFQADPSQVISDIWQEMLKNAALLIGEDFMHFEVYFTENGQKITTSEANEPIQRDRQFQVHLNTPQT